ncbi:hypothetical protein [Oricola sp.]|uniref:hypothetical protein n=1 Tax=Oricola sp. TaxID=1979950 RepID=UPI003518C24B
MFDRPELYTETDMTPESIVADDIFSREEKIRRLRDMKHELGRKAEDGSANLEAVEERMAEINIAVTKVKREQAENDAGEVLGRTPSA